MKSLLLNLIIALLIPFSLWAQDTSDPSSNTQTGSGNGWVSLSSAYANGGGYAYSSTCVVGKSKYAWWYGFSHAIPTGSTIDGIRIRSDMYYSTTGCNSGGCSKKNHTMALSWNGINVTSIKSNAPTASETVKYFGSSSDTWGHSWTSAELNSSTNYRVRYQTAAATCFQFAPPGGITQITDYIQSEVYYTEPATGPHIGVLSVWTPALITGALIEAMRHKVSTSRPRFVRIEK